MSTHFASAQRFAVSLVAACFVAGMMVSAAVPLVPVA